MSKCSTCRKADALDTTWEKIRYWFFGFFHQDILDLSSQKYTQGFADGYKEGYRVAQMSIPLSLEIKAANEEAQRLLKKARELGYVTSPETKTP